jgi:hypothetical protein
MEIARAASEALDQTPAEQIRLAPELGADSAAVQSQARKLLTEAIDENLDVAIIAFENAEATSALAPLVEPVSDVDVVGLLGDAWYAKGDDTSARKAYARALDKFVEAGEPVEQVFAVADTVARWASLRIGAGACVMDALPDRAWEDSWARLGGAPHDVCRLAKQDGGAEQPTPLASIEKLIKDAVMGCPLPPKPDEKKQLAPPAAFKKRVALIDCQRVKGAGDLYARSLLSAEAVDAEIVRALGTPQ